MKRLILFFATGFGSGYIPGMPGTYGSIVAAGIVWALKDLPRIPFVITLVTFLFVACWIAGQADIMMGTKDNQKIVIDEFAGMLVTFAFVPVTWKTLIAGFLLFRLFDIWKPFPIRWVQDTTPGGWGVVGDDVLAGVYANLILHALSHFGRGLG